MKIKLFGLAATLAVMSVVFAGSVSAVGRPFGDSTVPTGIVCTADVKVCPDGSTVGRSGPNCEFNCPSDFSPRPGFSPRPSFSPEPKGSPVDGRTNSCQARLSSIKNRSTSLVRLANEILTKFDSIVLGVEAYYTGKVVPSGKVLSNYQDLVKDIQNKKAAVQKSLSVASTDMANFNCNTGDSRTLLMKFNQDMRDVKSGLQDYRTSIKNLIVAVRGLVGNGTETTGSPRPFRTPFPTGSDVPRGTDFPFGRRSPGPAVNPF